MKAIGLNTYGGPEVLQVVDLPEPRPGAGEVRVRVRAAAIAPVDALMRTGAFAAAHEGLEPPFVPGMEISGVLDEVGPDAELEPGLAVGDPVVAFVDFAGAHGGYSDYVAVPAASVTRAPADASFPEAASFISNALTARNGLDALALEPGQTLLVTGAAGSVGGYLTQLGRDEGLQVVAIAAESDEDLVRSFGATDFVARGEDAAQHVRDLFPDGVDAVADGADLGDGIVSAIRDGGQIASFRGYNGDPGRGVRIHVMNVFDRATDHAAISRLRELVEEGVLSMRVGRVLPAAEATEAHLLMERGGTRGRIVLEFPVEQTDT
ncbi:NADP-dependent oxidoreductase [Streptomyces sp. NPDC050315]|uniref:quinone oxidoreductase family protein n=1 Tax=Streptomyces sp. NPDC050315 TaxID=3155039 RepID=UPI003434099D